MKFLLPVALLATAVVAQTSSACAAASNFDSCLGTTKGNANSCSATDYGCLCTAYQSIVTCYNLCPNDSGASSAQNARDTYCRYASTSTTSTATTTAATTSGSSSVQATTTGASSTTSTHSAASATGTNSGADLVMNAGGVLAAVAGVVVAML